MTKPLQFKSCFVATGEQAQKLMEALQPIDHVRVALETIKKKKMVLKQTDETENVTTWDFGAYTLIRLKTGAYGLIYKLDKIVAMQIPYNPLFESLIARVRAKKAFYE